MDWFKVRVGLPHHRKVQVLKALLKDPQGDIYPIRMMAWLASNDSKDGLIGEAFILEDVAGWRGKPGALTQAMLKAGFVDESRATLYYHDWKDENGDEIAAHIRKRERDKLASRARRSGDVAATPPTCSDPRTERTEQNEQNRKKPVEDSPVVGKPTPEPADAVIAGYRIPEKVVGAWLKAFPGVDVPQECQKAAAWELANPKLAKVNKVRFLQNWLSRAQDNAGRVNGAAYGGIQAPRRFGTVTPMTDDERRREALRDRRNEWDLKMRRMDRPFFDQHKRTPTTEEVVAVLGPRP